MNLAPSGGYVGVGTTSAQTSFHIDSTKDALDQVGTITNYMAYIRNRSSLTGQGAGMAFGVTDTANVGAAIIHKRTGNNSQGELQFYTKNSTVDGADPVQRMVIDSNGFVGIGTTSPSYLLDLSGSAVSGTTAFRVAGSDWTEKASALMAGTLGSAIEFDNTGFFAILSNTKSDVGMGTGAEFFRVTSSGNVGVGTAAPAYKLDVTGDVNASGCVRGSAGVIGGSCTSDARLKEDIVSFDLGLDELLGITPRSYRYNGLGGMPKSKVPEVGVIAQEVEQVAPELVQSHNVKLQPDDNEETEIKVVNYSRFTFMLINAIKELYADWLKDHQTIEGLKSSNKDLKAENAELKRRIETIEKKLDML